MPESNNEQQAAATISQENQKGDLQDLPWKTYVLLPRFSASQSHAQKRLTASLIEKRGELIQAFLMR